MVSFFPKYFTNKAIGLYIVLLLLCAVVFSRFLPVLWIIFGAIEVIFFFITSNSLTKSWGKLSEITFRKKLFVWSLTIRLLYAILMYFCYELLTGTHFEFNAGDSAGYHELAIWITTMLDKNDLSQFYEHVGTNYSDMGYPYYLGLMYFIFGKSILFIRIVKAILGAITCVLVYKLATRSFGEVSGKIAGILAMLSPNLIYYCGLHVKETEMIFLTVLFFERSDYILRSKKISIQQLILISLLGISLFFFRTVLGAAAFFALITSILFTPNKIVKLNRKIILYIWGGVIVLSLLGGAIQKNIDKYLEMSETNQEKGMTTRTLRKNGNKFSKYGTTVVFAPLVFIGPFPTLVNIETQQNQMLLNGGYFVRNILGFFFFLSLFALYKERKIRDHTLNLVFIFSYLAIIAMSTFALSERFHLPILPFIIIFSSYGITKVNEVRKNKYLLYLSLLSILVIGWNWFKLAGRI